MDNPLDKDRAGIQSVEVGFALLQALIDAPGPLALKDLAAAAGMPAAKAHRYLVSYQRSGLVKQDAATSRYDLGPMAFPLLPPQPVPFTVAEYFPLPGMTAFHDDRQHAVSLAFVVPVTGTCEPRQDALEVTWMSPEEASSESLASEMEGGRSILVRQALASVGALR